MIDWNCQEQQPKRPQCSQRTSEFDQKAVVAHRRILKSWDTIADPERHPSNNQRKHRDLNHSSPGPDQDYIEHTSNQLARQHENYSTRV